MTKRYQLIPAILFILIAPLVFADSIRISQVDSGDLLLNQEVKLYLSVTDDRGNPISGLRQDNFDILESSDGMLFKPVEEITGFQAGINDAGGVNFLLLIDNSESMYWTLEGRKTKSEARRRMTIAKKAVTSFINSIKNPNDTVGVAVYNSYYKLLAAPSNQIGMVEQQLDAIERPQGDAIYTEIYASLSLAIEELGITKGRKAVIILSDGVNNPAYPHTNKINEQFGAKFTP
ncbi:MAG: VWA domain-containing protein, partial [Proteobacteria bacterium]|nr:VWA domain-containing protein [Pseudomonadota bacterium]